MSVVRRRLRVFLATALTILIGAIAFCALARPVYVGTAAVMIDTRRQQVIESQAVLSTLTAEAGTIDTEVEILRSRRLAEQVVEALDLRRDPEFNTRLHRSRIRAFFTRAAVRDMSQGEGAGQTRRAREAIVDAVQDRLSIRRLGLTYMMNIGFKSGNPEKAARIANAFAEIYLRQQLEARSRATREANAWLTTRLDELRLEVQEAESAVEQYRAGHNLLSASGVTLTEQEISAYNQQLAVVRAQQAEDEARLRTARAQLAGGSSGDDVGEALGSQVVQQLRTRRADISGRFADLSSRLGPRHPDMIRVERELADIDGQIQAEIHRLVSNLEARVQVSRERTASMAHSLADARSALAVSNVAGVRLNELMRDAESSRSLYRSLSQRFQETNASEGLAQADARIVSLAVAPSTPNWPNRPVIMGFGLALGVALGVVAAALAEGLYDRLATRMDVERKLGLTSLGAVPLVSSIAEDADGLNTPVDYLAARPLSAFAEAIRGLRAAMVFSLPDQASGVVAVVSALPGEGKTTTAACLGRSAALAGRSVVIVDCDLRRGGLGRVFGAPPQVGWMEVLDDTAPLKEALFEDPVTGAHVLIPGSAGFTPQDVFNSPAMGKLLETLRRRYQMVILDTAPVLAVSDTRAIAARADVTVFLAQWRKTPDKAATNALRLLEQSGARIAGAALIQVDMRLQVREAYGDPDFHYGAYSSYYAN